ncbi:MAG TPA: hypothetical protein VHY79_12850 [Rhizomicrobium sp.]|nr:hypothetical protein [Rhizomicrobium sp.]
MGGSHHGFVRAADGSITSIDVSNADDTLARALNVSSVVTRNYYDFDFVSHGYYYSPDGTATSFDPAGSVATFAFGIDAQRGITGNYLSGADSRLHGLLYTP